MSRRDEHGFGASAPDFGNTDVDEFGARTFEDVPKKRVSYEDVLIGEERRDEVEYYEAVLGEESCMYSDWAVMKGSRLEGQFLLESMLFADSFPEEYRRDLSDAASEVTNVDLQDVCMAESWFQSKEPCPEVADGDDWLNGEHRRKYRGFLREADDARKKTRPHKHSSSTIGVLLCAVMFFGILVVGGASDETSVGKLVKHDAVTEMPTNVAHGKGVYDVMSDAAKFTAKTVKEASRAAETVKDLIFDSSEKDEADCYDIKVCDQLAWENFALRESADKMADAVNKLSSGIADIGVSLGKNSSETVQKVRRAAGYAENHRKEEGENPRGSSPGVLRALELASEAVKLINELGLDLARNGLKEILGGNMTCHTLRCNVVEASGLLFDFSYLMATDPLSLVDSWTKTVKSIFSEKLQDVARIFGLLGLFLMVNLLIYATTRFAKLCTQARKFGILLLRIPIVNMCRVIVVKVCMMLFDAMEAAKAA